METYLIPPEDCLIVRAIHQSTSLRDAAELLSCDPAGLFRKVKRISEEHQLLVKLNGKWALTEKGQSILGWTEESIRTQRLAIESKRTLRIASTTWFGEQALIPNISTFAKSISTQTRISIQVPNESFENSLKNGGSDLVIVCHAPFDPSIAYKKVSTEEWITIAPLSYQKALLHKSEKDVGAFLGSKPFIHHNELNPNSVVPVSIESGVALSVDNLVGVRAAVLSGLGWSVVPRILVRSALKVKELIEVPQIKPSIENQVCIWWLRDRSELKKIATAFAPTLADI